MKEIDFLPDWYKSDRRQQISYRTQYIALGAIFVAMMLCNLATTRSIAKITKELTQEELKGASAKDISREFTDVKNAVSDLQNKVGILEKIDSKIDVASVLAEISFLIDKRIILGRVEFVAERLEGKQAGKQGGGSTIRLTGGNFIGKERPPLGNVGFKVVLSGVAADASEVAELICKLEESPYFRHIYPLFSRNATIKTVNKTVGESLQVTKFEINCHLANYRQDGVVLAKGQQNRNPWR